MYGTKARIHTAATVGWLRAGIGRKSSPSYEVKESDIRRAVAAIADLPSSTLPDSPFILTLGTPAAQNVPPQTGTLAQRALEEWERTLCENKAVAILEQMQAGRPALIQKDGGEMLIAIVLDRPLADAKALVDDPAAFTQEMTRILLEKQSHPLIAQMIKPAGSSDPPPSNSAASSSGSMNTTALVRQCSSSNRKWSTWGTHGCHLLRRYHCAIQVLPPKGPHGWLVLL